MIVFNPSEAPWTLEHGAVLEERHRQPVVVDRRHFQQLAGLRVTLHVEPSRRHAVAGQEITQVMRRAGEAMPDQPDPAGLERGTRLPGSEQIFDDGEQLLLGRVPRLEQVIVERNLVDRLDGSLRVGVRRQQHPFGRGDDLPRAHQIVGA